MKTKDRVSAIIPAAGLSSRMNGFKPLLPFGKKTVLETTIDLFKFNGIEDIIVVTGHRSSDLEKTIRAAKATPVFNPDFSQGMFSSLLTGIGNLPEDCDAFFILPADIPAIRPHTISRMLLAMHSCKEKIIYPVFEGLRGHPPLISAEFRNEIENFKGNGGLRACLQAFEHMAQDLRVCDRGILMDADTRDDYDSLLKRSESLNIPEYGECICLLEKSSLTDDNIIAHCKKVAQTAVKICTHIESHTLNIRLIEASGLLHDIARGEPDHAEKGGKILRDMGFPDVADIVSEHMDLQTATDTLLNEKEIVYFADKLVVKDQLIPDFEKRFRDKLTSYKNDPDALKAIGRRLETACIINRKLSGLLNRDLNEVLQ